MGWLDDPFGTVQRGLQQVFQAGSEAVSNLGDLVEGVSAAWEGANQAVADFANNSADNPSPPPLPLQPLEVPLLERIKLPSVEDVQNLVQSVVSDVTQNPIQTAAHLFTAFSALRTTTPSHNADNTNTAFNSFPPYKPQASLQEEIAVLQQSRALPGATRLEQPAQLSARTGQSKEWGQTLQYIGLNGQGEQLKLGRLTDSRYAVSTAGTTDLTASPNLQDEVARRGDGRYGRIYPVPASVMERALKAGDLQEPNAQEMAQEGDYAMPRMRNPRAFENTIKAWAKYEWGKGITGVAIPKADNGNPFQQGVRGIASNALDQWHGLQNTIGAIQDGSYRFGQNLGDVGRVIAGQQSLDKASLNIGDREDAYRGRAGVEKQMRDRAQQSRTQAQQVGSSLTDLGLQILSIQGILGGAKAPTGGAPSAPPGATTPGVRLRVYGEPTYQKPTGVIPMNQPVIYRIRSAPNLPTEPPPPPAPKWRLPMNVEFNVDAPLAKRSAGSGTQRPHTLADPKAPKTIDITAETVPGGVYTPAPLQLRLRSTDMNTPRLSPLTTNNRLAVPSKTPKQSQLGGSGKSAPALGTGNRLSPSGGVNNAPPSVTMNPPVPHSTPIVRRALPSVTRIPVKFDKWVPPASTGTAAKGQQTVSTPTPLSGTDRWALNLGTPAPAATNQGTADTPSPTVNTPTDAGAPTTTPAAGTTSTPRPAVNNEPLKAPRTATNTGNGKGTNAPADIAEPPQSPVVPRFTFTEPPAQVGTLQMSSQSSPVPPVTQPPEGSTNSVAPITRPGTSVAGPGTPKLWPNATLAELKAAVAELGNLTQWADFVLAYPWVTSNSAFKPVLEAKREELQQPKVPSVVAMATNPLNTTAGVNAHTNSQAGKDDGSSHPLTQSNDKRQWLRQNIQQVQRVQSRLGITVNADITAEEALTEIFTYLEENKFEDSFINSLKIPLANMSRWDLTVLVILIKIKFNPVQFKNGTPSKQLDPAKFSSGLRSVANQLSPNSNLPPDADDNMAFSIIAKAMTPAQPLVANQQTDASMATATMPKTPSEVWPLAFPQREPLSATDKTSIASLRPAVQTMLAHLWNSAQAQDSAYSHWRLPQWIDRAKLASWIGSYAPDSGNSGELLRLSAPGLTALRALRTHFESHPPADSATLARLSWQQWYWFAEFAALGAVSGGSAEAIQALATQVHAANNAVLQAGILLAWNAFAGQTVPAAKAAPNFNRIINLLKQAEDLPASWQAMQQALLPATANPAPPPPSRENGAMQAKNLAGETVPAAGTSSQANALNSTSVPASNSNFASDASLTGNADRLGPREYVVLNFYFPKLPWGQLSRPECNVVTKWLSGNIDVLPSNSIELAQLSSAALSLGYESIQSLQLAIKKARLPETQAPKEKIDITATLTNYSEKFKDESMAAQWNAVLSNGWKVVLGPNYDFEGRISEATIRIDKKAKEIITPPYFQELLLTSKEEENKRVFSFIFKAAGVDKKPKAAGFSRPNAVARALTPNTLGPSAESQSETTVIAPQVFPTVADTPPTPKNHTVTSAATETPAPTSTAPTSTSTPKNRTQEEATAQATPETNAAVGIAVAVAAPSLSPTLPPTTTSTTNQVANGLAPSPQAATQIVTRAGEPWGSDEDFAKTLMASPGWNIAHRLSPEQIHRAHRMTQQAAFSMQPNAADLAVDSQTAVPDHAELLEIAAALQMSGARSVVLIAPATGSDAVAVTAAEVQQALPQARVIRGLTAAVAAQQAGGSATHTQGPTVYVLGADELSQPHSDALYEFLGLQEGRFDALVVSDGAVQAQHTEFDTWLNDFTAMSAWHVGLSRALVPAASTSPKAAPPAASPAPRLRTWLDDIEVLDLDFVNPSYLPSPPPPEVNFAANSPATNGLPSVDDLITGKVQPSSLTPREKPHTDTRFGNKIQYFVSPQGHPAQVVVNDLGVEAWGEGTNAKPGRGSQSPDKHDWSHLWPAVLGGLGDMYNIVATPQRFNRSEMKDAENEIVRAVRAGQRITGTVTPLYWLKSDGSLWRQEPFAVSYHLTGDQGFHLSVTLVVDDPRRLLPDRIPFLGVESEQRRRSFSLTPPDTPRPRLSQRPGNAASEAQPNNVVLRNMRQKFDDDMASVVGRLHTQMIALAVEKNLTADLRLKRMERLRGVYYQHMNGLRTQYKVNLNKLKVGAYARGTMQINSAVHETETAHLGNAFNYYAGQAQTAVDYVRGSTIIRLLRRYEQALGLSTKSPAPTEELTPQQAKARFENLWDLSIGPSMSFASRGSQNDHLADFAVGLEVRARALTALLSTSGNRGLDYEDLKQKAASLKQSLQNLRTRWAQKQAAVPAHQNHNSDLSPEERAIIAIEYALAFANTIQPPKLSALADVRTLAQWAQYVAANPGARTDPAVSQVYEVLQQLADQPGNPTVVMNGSSNGEITSTFIPPQMLAISELPTTSGASATGLTAPALPPNATPTQLQAAVNQLSSLSQLADFVRANSWLNNDPAGMAVVEKKRDALEQQAERQQRGQALGEELLAVFNSDKGLQGLAQALLQKTLQQLAEIPRAVRDKLRETLRGAGVDQGREVAQALAMLETLHLKRSLLRTVPFDFPGNIWLQANPVLRQAVQGYAIRLLAAGVNPKIIKESLNQLFGKKNGLFKELPRDIQQSQNRKLLDSFLITFYHRMIEKQAEILRQDPRALEQLLREVERIAESQEQPKWPAPRWTQLHQRMVSANLSLIPFDFEENALLKSPIPMREARSYAMRLLAMGVPPDDIACDLENIFGDHGLLNLISLKEQKTEDQKLLAARLAAYYYLVTKSDGQFNRKRLHDVLDTLSSIPFQFKGNTWLSENPVLMTEAYNYAMRLLAMDVSPAQIGHGLDSIFGSKGLLRLIPAAQQKLEDQATWHRRLVSYFDMAKSNQWPLNVDRLQEWLSNTESAAFRPEPAPDFSSLSDWLQTWLQTANQSEEAVWPEFSWTQWRQRPAAATAPSPTQLLPPFRSALLTELFGGPNVLRRVIPIDPMQLPGYQTIKKFVERKGYVLDDYSQALVQRADPRNPGMPITIDSLSPPQDVKKALSERYTGNFQLVLSRDPLDIYQASAGRSWQACYTVHPSRMGVSSHALREDVCQGSLILSVVATDDPTGQRMMGRVFLRPYDGDRGGRAWEISSDIGWIPKEVVDQAIQFVASILNKKQPDGVYTISHGLIADIQTFSRNSSDLPPELPSIRPGADLHGRELGRVDFEDFPDTSAVNLSEANLSSVGIVDVDLAGANLSRANLSNSTLIGVDLSGADLSGADLSNSTLIAVNLSGANLRGANLSRVDLSDVDLSGADLTNAIMPVGYGSEWSPSSVLRNSNRSRNLPMPRTGPIR